MALLLPLAFACDVEEEPAAPTIVDKSAEEAADLTTELACDYVARCGIIEVTCADCASGDGEDCGGCYAEVVEVTPDACADDLLPELEAGFGCQTLTAEEEALVDECLAALPVAQCTTVEEVEAWANGGPDFGRPDALAACDVIEDILSRCEEASPIEEDPGEPTEPPPA